MGIHAAFTPLESVRDLINQAGLICPAENACFFSAMKNYDRWEL
jgi:hypothetical protein